MTDEELEKAIAIEVMGWMGSGSGMWADRKTGLLTNYKIGGNLSYSFSPLTNANHRDRLVEEMIAKGWWYEGSSFPGLHIAQFHKRLGSSGPKQDAETKGHAVGLAALKAVRGEKP